jgi:hypothetical protein
VRLGQRAIGYLKQPAIIPPGSINNENKAERTIIIISAQKSIMTGQLP